MKHHSHADRPVLVLAALAALATTRSAQETARVAGEGDLPFELLDSPAIERSSLPNITVSPGGRVFLSWVEQNELGESALIFAAFVEGAWWPARIIAHGTTWFVNWADFPALAARSDDALTAHFLDRHPGAEGTYAYDVQITSSTDGGRTWRAPRPPHTDGSASEHGFVSLVPWSDERTLAVWLDGRETAGGEAAAHGGDHGDAGSMTLRAAAIGPKGELSEEALLDPRVCDCCQTSAALTAKGAVVAYRDRSDEEVRDISIVRFEKGRWSSPETLHEDGWVMPGCPVDGPAVAADGDAVAVAWFTGADDEPRVQVALSSDGGATFGEPTVVDDGRALGRADVVLLASGEALVSWIETVDGGAEVRVRRVGSDGELAGDSRTLTRIWPTRASGFPRIARFVDRGDERVRERVMVAWTDASDPSHVRVGLVTP